MQEFSITEQKNDIFLKIPYISGRIWFKIPKTETEWGFGLEFIGVGVGLGLRLELGLGLVWELKLGLYCRLALANKALFY